jgi:hypothetical protein
MKKIIVLMVFSMVLTVPGFGFCLGHGHNNTQSGGHGHNNTQSGGHGDYNTQSGGHGYNNTQSGGHGYNNTQSGSHGDYNTQSGHHSVPGLSYNYDGGFGFINCHGGFVKGDAGFVMYSFTRSPF